MNHYLQLIFLLIFSTSSCSRAIIEGAPSSPHALMSGERVMLTLTNGQEIEGTVESATSDSLFIQTTEGPGAFRVDSVHEVRTIRRTASRATIIATVAVITFLAVGMVRGIQGGIGGD